MSNEASEALCSSLKTSHQHQALLLAVSQLYLQGTQPGGLGRWLLPPPLELILKLDLEISVNIWSFVLQSSDLLWFLFPPDKTHTNPSQALS